MWITDRTLHKTNAILCRINCTPWLSCGIRHSAEMLCVVSLGSLGRHWRSPDTAASTYSAIHMTHQWSSVYINNTYSTLIHGTAINEPVRWATDNFDSLTRTTVNCYHHSLHRAITPEKNVTKLVRTRPQNLIGSCLWPSAPKLYNW